MKISNFFAWISGLVCVVGSDTGAHDGCHFVGARFARSVSKCESGVCTGISINKGGRYSSGFSADASVSCAKAASDTDKFFQHSSAGPGRRAGRKRPREDPAIALNDLIAGDLRNSLIYFDLTGNFNATEARLVFSQVEAAALAAVGLGWRDRTSLIAHDTWNAMNETLTVLAATMNSWPYRPFSDDFNIAAIANFYFDLAAIVGIHSPAGSGNTGMWSFISRLSAPIHRDLGFQDCARKNLGSIGFPSGTARSLELVRSLKSITEHSSMLQAALFTAPRLEVQSSADALVLDAMHARCTGLDRYLGELISSSTGDITRKLVVSWLQFCQGRSSRAELYTCRESLLVSEGAIVRNVQSARITFDEWLKSLPGSRFGALLPRGSSAQVTRIAEGFMEIIVRQSLVVKEGDLIRFREPVIKNAKIVGFAIAIAGLAGSDFARLSFPRDLVMFLHPGFRRSLSTLESFRTFRARCEAILSDPKESLVGLIWGVRKALGVGGADVVTQNEWDPMRREI